MLQEIRLKTWAHILSVSRWDTNPKLTYYKVYYPDLTDYGSVRAPYISYFGGNILCQPRLKYGKPTRPDEYSVHTYSGVWLMNVHEEWIDAWTGREFPDVVARPYKPLRNRPVTPARTESMAASGATPIEITPTIEVGENLRRIAFIDLATVKVENVILKQDFSNLTFEQLFEV